MVLDELETLLRKELISGIAVTVDLYGLDFESQAEEAEALLRRIDGIRHDILHLHARVLATRAACGRGGGRAGTD